MQVTHENDHVTHAVIGGKETIEFGISSSAEFFNILSSTLYSDQLLAVVREVLCNAWDAHIVAGCTDRAVEVSLSTSELVVRDFGLGIPHDQIGPIYGTYGNSTKKNDGKQTGGFGLGCKAPFAYTEHFEVISTNGGIRTIYAISKSSAQALGKPGITPITSFPSTDHGLAVKIPVKCAQDYQRLNSLIQSIAHNGDMNVVLNGKKVETINFPSDENYLVTCTQNINLPSVISVRYGNVIYPVTPNADIQAESKPILELLNSIECYGFNPRIIFQAPPHSIAVTPSREQLSMSSHTVNTLREIFAGFNQKIHSKFNKAISGVAVDVIEKAVKARKYNALLSSDKTLPWNLDKGFKHLPTNSVDELAKYSLFKTYPKRDGFREFDLTARLNLMVQDKMLDAGLVLTFIAEMKANRGNRYSNWLTRRLVRPLLAKIARSNSEHIRADQLYLFAPEKDFNRNKYYSSGSEFIPLNKIGSVVLEKCLPLLSKMLIITSRRDFEDRANKHETVIKFGGCSHAFVYVVGRKKGADEAARKHFENSGFNIVDLTKQYAWDPAPVKREPVKRKPALKGFPLLSTALRGGDSDVCFTRCTLPAAPRTETPEFYVERDKDTFSVYRIKDLSPDETFDLVQRFGDKGVYVTGLREKKKAIAAGAVDVFTWLGNLLANHLATVANLEHVISVSKDLAWQEAKSVEYGLIHTIWKCPELLQHYGITGKLSDEDKFYFDFFNSLKSTSSCHTQAYLDMTKKIHAVPINAKSKALIDKLEDNELLNLLDNSFVGELLTSSDPQKKAKTMQVLIDLIG